MIMAGLFSCRHRKRQKSNVSASVMAPLLWRFRGSMVFKTLRSVTSSALVIPKYPYLDVNYPHIVS